MDMMIFIIIALFLGVAVLGFILKALLYKGYDKARNSYVRNKNVANPSSPVKLADMYNQSDSWYN